MRPSHQEQFPHLEPIEGDKVILEHRLNDTLDLVVYETPRPVAETDAEGKVIKRVPRRIKWVARLGRADDRDRSIAQEDGPPRPIPSGRAYPDQGYIGHIGLVHSPVVELTRDEWDDLLTGHMGSYIEAMVENNELLVREVSSNAPMPTRTTRRKAAAKRADEASA